MSKSESEMVKELEQLKLELLRKRREHDERAQKAKDCPELREYHTGCAVGYAVSWAMIDRILDGVRQ